MTLQPQYSRSAGRESNSELVDLVTGVLTMLPSQPPVVRQTVLSDATSFLVAFRCTYILRCVDAILYSSQAVQTR